MIRHRLIQIFAIISSFVAYLTVLLGALVTKTGSGQGCGTSWPFCHGQLIPDSISVQGAYEYSHRIISGTDGFLILVLTVWAWLMYRHDVRTKLLGFLSLFFVVLQGGLGALTVMYEGTFALNWLLSLHFGFSLISFASVVLLTIHLFQTYGSKPAALPGSSSSLGRLPFYVWGLTAYSYIIVYTGALVRHAGATLGCGTEVPGCGSTYLPNLTSAAGIQMLHRYSAASLWILTLCLLIVILRHYQQRTDIVRGAWWAIALLTLQGASGVATVLSGGQLVAALAHTTIIAVYFAVLCYLCMQTGWPWQRQKQTSAVESDQVKLETLA